MTWYNKISKAYKFTFGNSYNLLLLLAWGAILLGYWRGINNQLPILGLFTDELEWIIVLLPLLFSLSKVNSLLKTNDYIFWFFCSAIYACNFILYPENEEALNHRFFTFCILVLPYYFIGVVVDLEKYLKPFYYVSIVSICFCAAYELFYLQSGMYSGELNTSDYNMGHAYDILPHVLMVSWFALKEFKPLRFSIMLLGIFMLISFGTRGPIACSVLFIAGYMLLFKEVKHGILTKMVVVVLGAIFFVFIDPIMLLLNTLTIDMGMSTRLFDLYFNNEIDSVTSRDAYKDALLMALKSENPTFGFGVLGSFRFIHSYPHKIWLEFIFSFGWFVGVMLLAALAFRVLISYFKTKTEDEKVFLFVLIICGVVKLFMSGSFLDETFLFFLLGYCTNIIRKYRQ